MTGTAFTGNTATGNRGGGAYFNGTAELDGATFTANQTPADRGAGAYFRGSTALTRTDFIGNLAANRGAGAYFFAPAVLTNTRFISNTAGEHAGGAYFNAAFEMTAATFISNTAVTGSGGGAFQGGAGSGRIVNTLFTRNTSGAPGADLSLGTTGTTDVLHTTLANASTHPGAAIVVVTGTVNVTNTLFAHYAAGLAVNPGASANSDYNLFYDAPTNALTGTHSLTDTNPLFVNPAADNYRLGTYSPALGAGVDAGIATDLDGDARGNPPSMGAYELGVPTEANLALSKEASTSEAAPGALITYTLVVTNTGPLPATTLQLTDTLSLSSTFQSLAAPGGWSCTTPAVDSTGTVACSAAGLAVSETITFTLVARLNSYLLASTPITNTATITAAEPDSTDNTATALTEIYAYQVFFPLVR